MARPAAHVADGARSASVELTPAPLVLLMTPDFPPGLGGIQRSMYRTAANLTRLRVRIVTLAVAGSDEFDAGSGLLTRRVRAGRMPAGARNAQLNAVALASVVRERPDVVLSAHIVTCPAAAAAALAGVPFVQWFHAKEVGHRPRLAAFAARRAAASVAVSSYTRGLLGALGAPRERVHVIPPGVDLPPPAAAERSTRPTVLTVARLEDRYKGHDVMLHAVAALRAEVPEVEWVVIGDGPLRGELEGRARELDVAANVRFLGALPDDERDRWLRRADVFAMPSRLPGGGGAGEGFGIVYMEAAAHGKPVVAGNVGGAVDAVGDGTTGLLVNPEDPAAVAGALARLLGDPALAARLGAAGAARAREFSWPRIAARVEELLLATIGGHGRDGAAPAAAAQPVAPVGGTRHP